MLPSIGIHHRNKYNAFCLADDIMEPYRPYVDWAVLHLPGIHETTEGLTREQKIELLKLPQLDVFIGELQRPVLLEDGFVMFQFSIYMRFCQSQENADVHTRRVKNRLPEKGKVGIFAITDKQFGRMEIFHGVKKAPEREVPQKLELF
jgi:CRISPR-associated endonuclease Cas2